MMAHRSRLYGLMLLAFCLLLAGSILAQQQQPGSQQPSPASKNPQSPEKASPGVEKTGAEEQGTASADKGQSLPTFHNDVVIRGGTILTVTHGRIENGSIYIHNGKIAEVGKTVNAPANA